MRRLLAAAAVLAPFAPAAGLPLSELNKDFIAAAEQAERATVVVRGEGAPEGASGCSGVVVHPDGYLLSHADATLLKVEPAEGGFRKVYADRAEVRLPDGKRYKARVLRRDAETGSSFLRIEHPAGVTFRCLRPGSSDEMGVGSFALLCGNACGTANEGRPAVSLGTISTVGLRDASDGGGRYLGFVTSAAVNPGSSGGPCVDGEGRLVGLVSTWGSQPTSAWYGLGLVVPVNRLRQRYRDLPESLQAFPDPKSIPPRAGSAALLEQAFQGVARAAAPAVASITFTREAGARRVESVVQGDKVLAMEAYGGPVSGVIYTPDGDVVTSVYNLWSPEKIQGIEVSLQDGRSFPARLLGRDQVRGIALLKIDAQGLPCLAPAPADQVQVGQFAFVLGNPYGNAKDRQPFLTFGLVSALHQLDRNRDALQTDAGMNDANAGGALVDLRGRLLGVSTLVAPSRFGRNSGIGFAIPVAKIEEALPRLRTGKNVIPGWLGVVLQAAPDKRVFLSSVVPGGAAAKAGLEAGDVIAAVDGQAIEALEQLKDLIGAMMAGDKVALKVVRFGKELEIEAVLGERPE